MITIKRVQESSAEVLALLGTITYIESHSQYIEKKTDLDEYLKSAFSVASIQQTINSSEHIFYILYVDNLPVGYAKLVLKSINESISSENNCQLEKIYILKDFIPLKLGQTFLSFLEDKAKDFKLDTMWLSVYKENRRAIRFYRKNNYTEVGTTNFTVNGTEYENLLFSKKI